ncbi:MULTISPECIES: thiamine phosphate synthase [unclassified Microcoleus]|uniref:thiamine phosphate synthase n=1 Tax=unclassified Microcoleus TaxID=2642155 RepID=UPI002FD0E31D
MTEKQNRTLPAQPALCRILDANLDRSREGLRIIEEWCRFGLNNAEKALVCKQLRQELAAWHTAELRSARDTPADPGTELTHPQEEQRSSIQQLLEANFCRVEEALRVLEEYGKVYDRNMGKAFKQMRYRVYTLESDLLAYRRYQQLLRSHLYLVTSPRDNLLQVVEAALQGGVTLVQYRDKTSDDGVRLANARQMSQLCHRYDALLIVNDRVDLAIAVDADGVHLGQQDLPVAEARKLLGPGRIIGCSTTNGEEMQRAIDAGADYIGVGPVYSTPTKPDKQAAGLDYVRYAADKSPVPWFAIGSIDINNLDQVLNAGAQRVAVVRSIMEAEQPTLVTQFFISQLIRMQSLKAQKALQGKS